MYRNSRAMSSSSSVDSAASEGSCPSPRNETWSTPVSPIHTNGTMDFLRRKGQEMWNEQIKASLISHHETHYGDIDTTLNIPQPTWRQVCERAMQEGWNLTGEVWQWQ